ncbi:MAG: hypothetical protein A3H27_07825 [Acidobacteria bacterium RIFCSPLOWO2_02_FULL_59_13]|nr:MAG: hypothetical protein A3H27_07825 [Acidobacteria bacterium RIFCSPLOWO2_02_FULL_59_13]
MLMTPKVLLLTNDDTEAFSLLEILGNYAFLVHARDISEVKSRLEENSCDVLLCAWSFYQPNWDGALQEVRERDPDLPVIVLSRTGGEREWIEVIEAGAFDLLAVPWQESTFRAVVGQAVVSHDARRVRKLADMGSIEQQAS